MCNKALGGNRYDCIGLTSRDLGGGTPVSPHTVHYPKCARGRKLGEKGHCNACSKLLEDSVFTKK